MDNIKIRKISERDIPQLIALGKQTFFETFKDQNSAEDMKRYLDESFNELKLKNEIKNPYSEFYFAILDNNEVGYLKINYGQGQTELKDDRAVEIERIYVLKDHQGKKIGQVLYNKAIAIARQRQADYIWLGVWEKNPKAINFYRKNGFVEFDKHIFKLGSDEQTDLLMRLTLT